MIHSVRLRLALWYALTISVLLGGFGFATWRFLVRTAEARADQSLQDMTDTFAKLWTRGNRYDPIGAAIFASAGGIGHDRRILVYDGAGQLVAMSDTTPLTPLLTRRALADLSSAPAAQLLRDAIHGKTRFVTLDVSGKGEVEVRARYMGLYAARRRSQGEMVTMIALRSLAAEQEATGSFVSAMRFAIPSVLVLALLGGYLLARASLAPVATMAHRAQRMSASDLDERFPVANPRDELGNLATVFNELLDRLKHAFEEQRRAADRQRQFMADASHELRTPVAAVTTVADVALTRTDRDRDELREALSIVRGEGLRMGRLVDDLLFLARADANEAPIRQERLYLEEVIQDSARSARGLAAQRGIALEVPLADEAPFDGDRDLLHRMVMIMLDNATKYTSAGGCVRLTLQTSAKGYEIAVADTGPGVPAEARERIFERFFRVDDSRARARADGASEGAGLGLSIARWIAEAHGGAIRLDTPSETGARFVVTLPMPLESSPA